MQVFGPYLARLAFGDPHEAALARPLASDHTQPDSPAEGASSPAGSRSLSPFQRHLLWVQQRAAHAWQQALMLLQAHVPVVRAHGHAALGLANLGYQMLYLLQATQFFSPALHVAGVRLVRDDGTASVCRHLCELVIASCQHVSSLF